MEIAIAIIIAAVWAAVETYFLIPFFKKHQLKQYVREVGPQSHLGKTGTPSMGGIAIFDGAAVSAIVSALIFHHFTWDLAVCLIAMLLYGLIGFIDDYQKAIKKNNKGISGKQKIVLQTAFGLGLGIYAYLTSDATLASNMVSVSSSSIFIPLFNVAIDLKIFYIAWVIFVMTAFSNSVNLTDGLDGLAGGITALVAASMTCVMIAFNRPDLPIFFAGICGACIGFLVFNIHPAKIFMGDTGSMALGGGLAAAAILSKSEFILALAGLVYVCESVSVIMQVSYFKLTHGKRIFKMAPIHHHFELCGMKETGVVKMFWTVTFVLTVLTVIVGYLSM